MFRKIVDVPPGFDFERDVQSNPLFQYNRALTGEHSAVSRLIEMVHQTANWRVQTEATLLLFALWKSQSVTLGEPVRATIESIFPA